MQRRAMQAYKIKDAETTQLGVEVASPHQLVLLLYDGALLSLERARHAMSASKPAQKGEAISKAISIIDYLRSMLDTAAGGQLAAQLAALYDYMKPRLLEANLKNDPRLLVEVAGLLEQIRSGWRAIGEAAPAERVAP